jgi:HEAT repeat protein
VRIRSALALSRFKDARAVPGLIDAQRWWQLRWEFVRRISAIGAPAVPALIEALHDEDAELREYAAHALGELEAESAVAALKKSAQDPVDKVRDASGKALAKMRRL